VGSLILAETKYLIGVPIKSTENFHLDWYTKRGQFSWYSRVRNVTELTDGY
jgi:hypothetical protein